MAAASWVKGIQVARHLLKFAKNRPFPPKRNIFSPFSRQQNARYKKIAGFCKTPKVQLAVISLIPSIGALGFGRKNDEKKDAVKATKGPVNPEEKVIKDADELFAENDIVRLYELLVAHKDTGNADVMWRLARAACHMGKIGTDTEAKKGYTYEAFQYIQRALQLNDQNFACHKWYAILLDYVGEYEGTKQRITSAYKVKEHLLRAIELNPRDATTIHSLGYWCFTIADLPWYQRKVASVIFATPPSSTYEEALKYFLDAEREDPNFYSMNLLLLGKTFLRLNDKDKAKNYLLRTRDYHVKTEDDKKAHKEAVELLAGLGVKD